MLCCHQWDLPALVVDAGLPEYSHVARVTRAEHWLDSLGPGVLDPDCFILMCSMCDFGGKKMMSWRRMVRHCGLFTASSIFLRLEERPTASLLPGSLLATRLLC